MPSAWRLAVAVVALILGVTVTTPATAATFNYNVPTLASVDVHHVTGADAAETQLTSAREASASPSVEGRGASTTPSARSVATNAVGGLSDDVARLAESNITASGDTVLGSYPGYITKANSRGASYFDIGDTWNTLTPAQRTAANNHFLDVISARGDRVLLSTPKTQIQAGTALADEIAYLTSEKGYVWANQWSLRPGG
jgi:hypothetical protein